MGSQCRIQGIFQVSCLLGPPGIPKEHSCIQRGPQNEKTKKLKQKKKERKKERKSSKVRIARNSVFKEAHLEFTNFIDYPPLHIEIGLVYRSDYPLDIFFSGCHIPHWISSLGPNTGLYPALWGAL